jgi:large subunit ribosomal protein L15
MRLNEISDRPGATRSKKRLGRGIGSGLGKTSGRGVKGQKARSGVAIKGFEGGQMPLHRRLPKRGFNNIFAKRYNELNLGWVQAAIDAGLLDAKQPVTAAALVKAGLMRRERDGVRLLGSGEIKAKVAFEVAGASASAIKAVEAAGGTVTLKSISGRERPPGDVIKAKRRADKRVTDLAKAEAKAGRGPKAKGEKPGEEAEAGAFAKQEAAKEAKPAKSKQEADAAKPAAEKKGKPAEGKTGETKAPKAKKDKT